jgi:N-acetylglucosaminyldiphosphoundecaprenol N-acetyl-beta-D-mannosaminyltransferase
MAAIAFPRSHSDRKPVTMPNPVPAYRVCGVRVDAHQLPSAVEAVLEARRSNAPLAVHLVNAGTLSLARHDESLAGLLERADLNLPDGMPLVWIARKRLGLAHMVDRCYGPDLMLAVLDAGRAAGLKHYFYGSSPDVVDTLATNIRARFPGVDIVGVESPPFRALSDDESAELVDRVRASGADVVWVGLGTPKQDVFVDAYRDRLGAALIAVGAAFDFHAGTKKQAPAWVQRVGMEWAFRLLAEPGRLWKRYLVGNTQFVWGVLRDKPVLVTDR